MLESLFLVGICLAPVGFLLVLMSLRPPGQCPKCSYDTRASTQMCPECGTALGSPRFLGVTVQQRTARALGLGFLGLAVLLSAMFAAVFVVSGL